MDANARRLRRIPLTLFCGCLLLSATPALAQEDDPVQQGPVPRDTVIVPKGNGGVSLGVLAGVGLNNADAEEAGRYVVADMRFVRPLSSLFGGGSDVRRGFKHYDNTLAPRRRRLETNSVSGGAEVSAGVETNDTWKRPKRPDPDERSASKSAQDEPALDHGGTVFGVVNLLLVFPVQDRFQLVPFAGVGAYRILEGEVPEEPDHYALAGRWGLVFDYGLELIIPFGVLDVRAQYRGFRYQVDELEYMGVDESFKEEIDPVNTSALLVGIGINF